jgi:hypothetical protein
MLEVFSKVPRAGFAAAQDDNQDLKTMNTSLWMYCAECFLGGCGVGGGGGVLRRSNRCGQILRSWFAASMLDVFRKVPRAGFAAAQDDNQDLKTTNTSLRMTIGT